MRAVNLLPPDHRKGKGAAGFSPRGPGYIVIGVLALALGLVTVYVVTNNSVAAEKSKLAALQQELPQVQALASRFGVYSQFSTLAQQRAQTVRQIAATRFDWAASMSDLAKVVPANTSLQALTATAGTSSTGGTAPASTNGGSASQVRGALPNPAFELRGCTGSQDDVARLLSRLRLMNGVARVTLSTAGKEGAAGQTGGTTGGSTPVSGTGSAGGSKCAASSSAFDIVVFFAAPAGAATSSGAAPSPAATPSGATPQNTAASGSKP